MSSGRALDRFCATTFCIATLVIAALADIGGGGISFWLVGKNR
jgi:hypothetical protein